MATGDMPGLNTALNQGLDAGLSISETREILVQLYAYVGFARSLNALNKLATVGALTATPGVEPQLRSHMAASLRVGLGAAQLRQITELLKKHGDPQTAERAHAALTQTLSQLPTF